MLGARRLARHEALGAGEPPGRAAGLAAKEQPEAQPERAAGSAAALPGIEMRLMRTFERLQVVLVPAGHPGGRREQLEVARRQRGGPVGARQRPERVRPLLTHAVRAAAIEKDGPFRAAPGRVLRVGPAHALRSRIWRIFAGR